MCTRVPFLCRHDGMQVRQNIKNINVIHTGITGCCYPYKPVYMYMLVYVSALLLSYNVLVVRNCRHHPPREKRKRYRLTSVFFV